MRSFMLVSSLVLILGVFANDALSDEQPGVLFQIGQPDAHAAEFGLADSGGYANYLAKFGDQGVTYTIGKSKTRDWPYVHPAPRDPWASNKTHAFNIEYTSRSDIDKPTYFIIGAAGSMTGTPVSTLVLTVNGQELPGIRDTGSFSRIVYDPKQKGEPHATIVEIPASLLRKGENTLSLRLDDGSWIIYDYVALRDRNEPLEIVTPPEPDLLADFLKDPMADVEEIVFTTRKPGPDGHWYANFGYYAEDENRLLYMEGGSLRKLNVRTGEITSLIEDPTGAVRDPIVHYDGTKILFSYRPGGTKYYHLYEMGVDGKNLRQLTDGPYDDIEPTYLPCGDIVFVSSRCNRWVNCWLTKVAVLYRCGPDGENIQQLSSNNEHDNTPWVLPNGQILYTRWEYVDRSQVNYHHLWITNPDGSRQTIFFGNMRPGITMIDAKPIPDSRCAVVSFSPGHGRKEHAGRITVLDPRRGPDDAQAVRSIGKHDNHRDPWAFSENAFMAAMNDQLQLIDATGREKVIHQLSQQERAAGFWIHEPRPIISRQREAVIADQVDFTKETGRLLLADIYEGRNMDGVERGEIKKLLVLETLPKPINYTGGMDPLTYVGSFTLERVVGTIPVEEDGSAYAELPALRSLLFVALDENDLAVKRMQSFLTVMPGETTSCVGCHEQRAQAPLSNFAEIKAMRRPPSQVEPITDVPDVLDFPRDIQPILNRHCVDCHGYEKTERGGPYAAGIILTGDRGPMFSHAYFDMTIHRLFSDGRNLPQSNYAPRSLGSGASKIMTMLDGSHYGVKATELEKKTMRLWIEVGAPYPGTYASLGCGSIGGYAQNTLIEKDFDWPETVAAKEAITRRCDSCHTGDLVLPKALADEHGLSFWQPKMTDPRLHTARHIMFNLTRPEKSLMLLAPLSKDAGGFGICKNADGTPASVFTDESDADYQKILAMNQAGRRRLDEIKRFDMPGFVPRPSYLREMVHYGVLPEDHDMATPVDFYELEQRYWESLWHKRTNAYN